MAKSNTHNDSQRHEFEDSSQSLSSLKNIAPGEILIGTLSAIDDEGKALVTYSGCSVQGIQALSTVEINRQQIGRQVAVLFANGDPDRPVIMGLIHSPLQEMLENFAISPAIEENSDIGVLDRDMDIEVFSSSKNVTDPPAIGAKGAGEGELATAAHEENSNQQNIHVDGQRILLEGNEEIVLKCGDASITLTKAGKIIIRGKYLLSRSSGVNRILGGSVQVN